jgi:XTP/dITP diphosphohydrolase
MTPGSPSRRLPIDLVIATRNPGKIREIRGAVDLPGLVVHTFEEFSGWPRVDEVGRTLEENAVIKATVLRDHFGMHALADDSGLEVDFLAGRPGVLSSRYAGPEEDPDRNIDLLLRELEAVPENLRTARFVCVIALALTEGGFRVASGECLGTILPERRGTGGFGYDPVFRPAGFSRSMAELSLQEKNSISHRGRALRGMITVLEELISGQSG